MKNYKVKYTKGHLVDIETGKRIFLKRGGTFQLLGDDDQFEEKDELQQEQKILDADEKWIQLSKSYKSKYLEKVADAGQQFVYRIGLSKMTSEDQAPEFLFNAIIKEDLYMHSKDGNNWSLCSCICETTRCVVGDIQMIETVKGFSLNNLFSNMVAFYFPLQRSGSCNAYNYFFFAEHDHYVLSEVKESAYQVNNQLLALRNIRSSLISKYGDKNDKK